LFNLGSHEGALLHTGVSCAIAVLFAGQQFYEFFTKIDMNVTSFLLGTRDSPSCATHWNQSLPTGARISLPNRVPDTRDQGARFVGRFPALFTGSRPLDHGRPWASRAEFPKP